LSANNDFDLLLNKLRETFDCKYVEFWPFPSITPNLIQGYRVSCSKLDKDINSICECNNCEYKES